MLATRRPIKLPCSRSIGGKRNDTKASFLHKTEGAPLCSAQACCAVEDGLNMGCRSCEELAMARSTSEIATRCAANSVTCSSECRRRASTQTINCWSIYTRIARPRPFTRMQRRRTPMKLLRRKFLHLAAGTAALPSLSRFAWAQAYPTRPVRLIVGFAPGGQAQARNIDSMCCSVGFDNCALAAQRRVLQHIPFCERTSEQTCRELGLVPKGEIRGPAKASVACPTSLLVLV